MAEQAEREISEIAAKHGFSEGAALALLRAMERSGGAMAQFSHPELGGTGQWLRGGMLMIGAMFDDALKARVCALAEELSRSFSGNRRCEVTSDDETQVPPLHRQNGERWWPEELGDPASTGEQNGFRYAVFPDKRRLAVEHNGTLSVRDTGEFSITGVSQAQGSAQTLRFSGPRGSVELHDLPVA